ncbi:MAG: DUF460 domain-containing protein [Candidatus Marsarchaeota archaeon]|nr:DUF460 domain-containing protein [Candidatus Marsarchaeota archaeon]
MRHIIVGIDPGKTSAIACLDLNGRPVMLRTGRHAGLEWFVGLIHEAGSPAVVACDKRNADHTASRLAAIFDAVLFSPREDIRVAKKDELRRAMKTRNHHERDALTAAVTAYNAFANKLNQVEHLSRTNGIDDIDTVKALVLKKHSFHEALAGKRAGRFVR